MSTEDPQDALREGRHAVRRFASGVAALTMTDDAGMHGTTVSSLTAVSKEPLLVGACLANGSSFLRRVRDRGWFAANVLCAGQQAIARWFSDPARPRAHAQFADLSWRPDPVSGAPLLAGALAHLACRVWECVPAGDHCLLLAEVAAGDTGAGLPLLHFAGMFYTASPARPVPGPARGPQYGKKGVLR